MLPSVGIIPRVNRLGLGLALGALLAAAACAQAADVQDAAPEVTASTDTPSTPSPTGAPTEPSTAPSPTAPTTASKPSSSRPTTSPEPDVAAAPEPGNCYDTRKRDFDAHRDGSEPVRCAQPHTAETFAVFRTAALPEPKAADRIWRVCQARFAGYVGDTTTVSSLGMTVITPSVEQVGAGQTWARCDVIERGNFNATAGGRRTGSLAGALTDGVPDRFRACSDTMPAVTKPVRLVPCSTYHRAELIPESTVLGGPNADYPGTGSARSAARQSCADVFRDYVPETYQYYFYYPTRASWVSGSHATTCWAVDPDGQGLPPI